MAPRSSSGTTQLGDGAGGVRPSLALDPNSLNVRDSIYATQAVRIIAVDLQTRTVLRVYELGGHEMGWTFLSPSCE